MKNKTLRIHNLRTISYTVEHKEYNGSPHLVVPVVMMVEGVHNGSRGPLLHTIDQLGAFPEAWDGIPITIRHPSNDEGYVSANSPEIIEAWSVGQVFHTHVNGKKLRAEAWINESKIKALSMEAYEHILAGHPLEVSLGMFSDELEEQGEYHGEQYIAVSKNPRPDHLALLPEQVGACSWEDGCGIRVNNKKGGKNVTINAKDLNKKGYSVRLITQQEGMTERIDKVRSALYAMDSDQKDYYLEEVFEGYVIFQLRDKTTDESALYRQSYQVDSDGIVVFTGDAQKVKRNVEYTIVTNRKIVRKKEVTTMSEKGKCTPCIEKKVGDLIAHEATRFTADDKEWLQTLEEGQLDTLLPVEKKVEPQSNTSDVPDVPVTKEQAIEVLRSTLSKPDDFIKLLPDELQEQMTAGLALHKKVRTDMVETILANTDEGVWNKEDLNAMDLKILTKLHNSVKKAEENYVLNMGDFSSTNAEELLLPPGVEESK